MSLNKELLGLDPLLRCCVQLQIKDVLNIQSAGLEECPDVLQVGVDHVTFKVEVMGLVVRVDQRERRHSYVVDDGTGVVTCTIWINKQTEFESACSSITDLPLSLRQKMNSVQVCQQEFNEEGYSLGDIVLIRGRLTEFMGQREIDVLDHRKVDNPNILSHHLLRLQPLYDYYKKSFLLPKKSSEELSAASGSKNGDNITVLQEEIRKYIQSNMSLPSEFSLSQALLWPCVTNVFDGFSNQGSEAEISSEVQKVLEALSNIGLLCKLSTKNNHYVLIRVDSPIVQETLRILHSSCKSDINAEKGCHIKQVLGSVKRHPSYHNLTLAAMQNAVDLLEENGDVVSLGDQRFLSLL